MNTKIIFPILALIITLIGIVFSLETQIEWTLYIGIGVVIIFGSAGFAFLVHRLEAIFGGLILAAFWPVLWEAFQTAISTL